MATEIQLRCVRNPRQLLGELRLSGERPEYTHPDNLAVLACRDCTRKASTGRSDGLKVRVTHLFDFAGNYVRTEEAIVPTGEPERRRRADTQSEPH